LDVSQNDILFQHKKWDQTTRIFQPGGYYTMAKRVKTNFPGEIDAEK
jgi:hypothetical protein